MYNEAQIMGFISEMVKNLMRRGQYVAYEHLFFFPECFQEPYI